jgi:POT family proton-dependent oligopeptide transporter
MSTTDPAANANQPLEQPKLKQPPGLWCLFIVEMWERFSYYGMRAILVLYMVAEMGPEIANPGRNWTDASAAHLYGYYTGLVYLTPILGGLIADRLIGTHRSMVAGALLISLGHVALAVSGYGDFESNNAGLAIFIAGLALIIFGTGHFKPCVSVMVGQLYEDHDPRRDGGFTIFYMGINVGAALAPIICGWLGEKIGWHYGFGAAAVGMILGLMTYLFFRPVYLKGIGDPPEGKANTMPLFILGSIILSGLIGLLFYFDLFRLFDDGLALLTDTVPALWLTIGGILLILVISTWFIASQGPGEKGPIFTVLCFIIFNAVFWLAFEQAGSTLTLFADRDTDRVLFGWEMPASWFQVINPVLIVTLAPVYSIIWMKLARRNMNPTQSLKIFFGLILLGGGFVFMVFAGALAVQGKVSPLWLVFAYLLHTAGELCLSPTGLSFVTKASPKRLISFIMGLWFLSSVVANLGGGLVAGTVTLIEAGQIDIGPNDGGKLVITDRVGDNKHRLMVLAPEGGTEDVARALGIFHPDGVNGDHFSGYSVAMQGYVGPAKTIGDLMDRVATASEGKITVTINEAGNALLFTDATDGSGELAITADATSHTADDLLISTKERAGYADGVITSENIVKDGKNNRLDMRAARKAIKLTDLNGGSGVTIREGAADLVITTRDGSSFSVDFGSDASTVRPVDAVETIGDVIDRMVDASRIASSDDIEGAIAEPTLQVTLMPEGMFIVSDKTRGDGSFTIASAEGGSTAADLGLDGTAEDDEITGKKILGELDVSKLTRNTKLSWFNTGDGVSFEHDATDFTITARDGSSFDINLGAVNAITDDTLLADLGWNPATQTARGVPIDDDPDTADILFIGCGKDDSYPIDLTGVVTVGDLAQRVSENTGKINPIWNQWGIKFAGKGDFFFLFVFSAAVAAVIVLILTPLFKRLLHGVE